MENSLIYVTETSHLTFNVIVCTTNFHYQYVNSNVFTHITFQELVLSKVGSYQLSSNTRLTTFQHKADKISTQS